MIPTALNREIHKTISTALERQIDKIILISLGREIDKTIPTALDRLFDTILYVPSTIFQLNRDESSWVEPVLN